MHPDGTRDFVSSGCTPVKTDTVTPSDVAGVFVELDLPASNLLIQPPDLVTLVNFDTNFYTDSTASVSTSKTVNDLSVTIEATPSQYHWNFGDGQSMTTTTPGAPYPKLTITHNYLLKGEYAVTLATTYTGRFKVNGGAWQDIPATVTIDGTPQTLRAIEAEPKLVGY